MWNYKNCKMYMKITIHRNKWIYEKNQRNIQYMKKIVVDNIFC